MNWRNVVLGGVVGGLIFGASVTARAMAARMPPGPDYEIPALSLKGTIAGENVTFALTFDVTVNRKELLLPLVKGPVAYLEAQLPPGTEIVRDGNTFSAKFTKPGKQAVSFTFAAQAARQDEWRETSFTVPAATVRKLLMVCDRDDLQVQFPGALNIERRKDEKEKSATVVSGFLATGQPFSVRWKPEVRKLDAELVVACDANTIAVARVGALNLDTVFSFRVVQGNLTKLTLALPPQLNVTQVRGIDIREWTIDKDAKGERRIAVTLNRPKDKLYQLGVESEISLPAFPAKADLPFIVPENVIRTSGFLMIGADSAIKLLVSKAAGLTQVDQVAFPCVTMQGAPPRPQPSRSAYAYQYANLPCQMELTADDIVTAMHSEDRIVLSLENNSLVLQATAELDIREAPAREIAFVTDAKWIVANVASPQLADYDVHDKDGVRTIQVFFKQGLQGRVLVDIRLERSLEEGAAGFEVPVFKVPDAKTERGYIVLRAEQGIRLKAGTQTGLREVHTGSLPTRVVGAQSAYRFKTADWKLQIAVEKADASIHAEIFSLSSLGENALYGSTSITYNIGSAPVKAFKVKVPSKYQKVDFTGRDIRGWQHEGEIYTISLQDKVSGDYTLLVTYDHPVAYEGDELLLGGIETMETESEVGYIALVGAASLAFVEPELKKDASVLPLSETEIPKEYAMLINAQVLRAYKYVSAPHQVEAKVKRYATQPLLDQVADHVALSTRISEEGEAVTDVSYFVKNTSQPDLQVKLPAKARLWSVTVDNQRVQVLTKENGTVLIPVERRRDPNQSLNIRLTYAEQQPRAKVLQRWTFQAPQTAARSVFAKWAFSVPQGFFVKPLGGNMVAPRPPVFGINHLFPLVAALWLALLAHGIGWIVLALAVVIIVAAFRFNAGRGHAFTWSSWLVGLATLFVLIVALQAFRADVDVFQYLNWPSMGAMHPRSIEMSKPVSMADSELRVTLAMTPHWFNWTVAGGWVALALIAGAVLILYSARRRRVAYLATALTLTAVVWAATLFAEIIPILAVLVAFALPLAIAVAIVRSAYARGQRRGWPEPYALPLTPPEPPEPPAPPAPPPAPPPVNGTTAAATLLLLAAGLAWLGLAPAASAAKPANPPVVTPPPAMQQQVLVSQATAVTAAPAPAPIMKNVTVTVNAPDLPKDLNRNAHVSLMIEFETKTPATFTILPPPYVMTDYTAMAKEIAVTAEDAGYVLHATAAGSYKVTVNYVAPVQDADGAWSARVWLPANLQNTVQLIIPSSGWDVQSPQAVSLKTDDSPGKVTTNLIAGPDGLMQLAWRPRERKTELEKAVFFADTATLVMFQPGLANLIHQVRYQIAQGELQSLALQVPKGMNVTAVNGPGLSTWRFDAETRNLEALLEKPVSGEYLLVVVTQMPKDSLPYTVDLALPTIQGASRQRGAIALAASDSVQIRPDDMTGLSGMNVGDFAAAGFAEFATAQRTGAMEVKRAFRYQQLPVTAKVTAERVLPELRVGEEATLDVSDERIVLSSTLQVAVSKAGVFSLRLDIPEDFDVESLTGDEVSHWDEVKEDGHGVIIHFTKQALGDRALNLVLSRMEKGLSQTIVVPRVGVRDALKHTGTLAVSGERGVRFTATKRDGVTEINPRELGIEQPGYLAFRLLRPNWAIEMKTEAMAPVVKAEMLQRTDVSDGMQYAKCYIQYGIEHAGVKLFKLQAPQPGVALTVAGKNIARVQQVEATKGLWEIELHGKVEKDYALEISYQVPYDHLATDVKVLSLKTVGTDAQKGFLVVFAGGRLRIQQAGEPTGLHAEDSRGVPAKFGAGDLSGAILCYRTTTAEYELALSVSRHGAADVLPAKVDGLRLVSVVSDDDQMITQATMNLQISALRFLEVALPDGNDLWAVFINGKAVVPLVEKKTFLIPLEGGTGGACNVEFIYGGLPAAKALPRTHAYFGPTFNLPLANVNWEFYLPPDFYYHAFEGTMLPRKGMFGEQVTFTVDQYTRDNQSLVASNLKQAEEVLEQGAQMWKEGRQQEAKQAMQSAITYSQGDQVLNEDARIQFRNLARQQAVVGLANRRLQLKKERNVADEQSEEQLKGFNGGNWNKDYSAKVEQSLGAKENDSLNAVANKMLDQQLAAQAEVHPIRITMPIQGRHLAFYRELQIKPQAAMTVSFKAGAGWPLRVGGVVLTLLGLALVFWVAARAAFARRGA